MTTLSLGDAARDDGDRVALIADGRAWTFAELAAEVARVRTQLPASTESPYVLRAAPELRTLFSVLALVDARLPFAPLHPRLTDVEARAHAEIASAISFEKNRPNGDPLAVLFTSGTTGVSKAAILSRRAFEASARASAANLPWREDDRTLLCMPLSHVGGLSIVTRSLLARRAIVFHPRFEADAVLASIPRDGVTRISVVPTMLHDLLERDRDDVLARLETVLLGGAAAPVALLEACAARGIRVLTTYGLTEACSQVTTQAPHDPRVVLRGSGRPLDGLSLRIVKNGTTLAEAGEIGSISIRGPQMMDGYTGAPPLGDGWFDTGDLGTVDEHGELHVLTRRSDLIVSGGENVYPLEVEAALASVTGVRSAVVFGVEHERWGQEVAAVLVVGTGFDEERALKELRTKLAAFKCPKRIAVAEALPLASNGKVARSEVVRTFTPALRPWRGP